MSNIIGFEDQGTNPQSQRFGYDMLDRIISYQAANDAQTFEYDPNGNRTAKRQQNNLIPYLIEANSNRLMGIGNAAQQLDANGNLLNDGKFLYTYNAQNRLANVDGIYRYTYNANQQRVQKTTPQGTTLYAWANGRIIGEYDQSGTAKQETVYMGTTPIATIQQGKVYRIYADQLDTPRVITDASGQALWRWDSSPFGETAANEDADGDGIALNYNPRFPGQLYDAETGLHYNYHRDYNPETGRYVQSDPIGLAGGLNTFGYANQNPYGFVDPDGLVAETPWDLLNVGMGAASFGYNLWQGNWGAAAVDGLGVILDTGATFVPFLPGGAATVIQAGRATDKLADAAKLCFVKGTPVHTQSGLKPIEDVKVGDLVASRSDATGETTWKPVARLFRNKDKTILKLTLTHPDGKSETLGVTPEHPFNVVNEGWVEAGKLSVGAVIHSLDGQPIRVQSVEQEAQRQDTYNFEVADYHTYFVGQNGVWVHNVCGNVAKGGIPFGFKNVGDFTRFGDTLNAGLSNLGYSNVQVLLQGSAVTGKSFRTGRSFDEGRVSDFDIALAGSELLLAAKQLGIGLRSKGTRTGPLSPFQVRQLGLDSMQSVLSQQAGRPVNGSVDAAAARAPSIRF